METLEQLGLTEYKTSNYANYLTIRNVKVICCGMMDIHEDSDNLGIDESPIFKVKPLYWNKNVVFVYKPKTRWYTLSKDDFLKKKRTPGIKFIDDSFSFNATKFHGLVPKTIAESLNNDGYLESDEYRIFSQSCGENITPQLVWQWA